MSGIQMTDEQRLQVAAALFAACPGIYVAAIQDPEKAYETGRVAGEIIAGVVKGFEDATQGFMDGFEKLNEVWHEEKLQIPQIPHDCENCWCQSCGNFDDCFLHHEGLTGHLDIENLCPCDGCRKGMRFMPKEQPPTCGKYIERKSEKMSK